jgi:hypothetical protein
MNIKKQIYFKRIRRQGSYRCKLSYLPKYSIGKINFNKKQEKKKIMGNITENKYKRIERYIENIRNK